MTRNCTSGIQVGNLHFTMANNDTEKLGIALIIFIALGKLSEVQNLNC